MMMNISKGENGDACLQRCLRGCLVSEKEVACEEQQQWNLMTETKNGTVIMKIEGHSASTMTVNSGTHEQSAINSGTQSPEDELACLSRILKSCCCWSSVKCFCSADNFCRSVFSCFAAASSQMMLMQAFAVW